MTQEQIEVLVGLFKETAEDSFEIGYIVDRLISNFPDVDWATAFEGKCPECGNRSELSYYDTLCYACWKKLPEPRPKHPLDEVNQIFKEVMADEWAKWLNTPNPLVSYLRKE